MAAGTYPDRTAAAASYHGGQCVRPMNGQPALARAERSRRECTLPERSLRPVLSDEIKERLEQALTDAGLEHEVETYQAKHGWVLRDTPAYDAAAAQRHWETLIRFFRAER